VIFRIPAKNQLTFCSSQFPTKINIPIQGKKGKRNNFLVGYRYIIITNQLYLVEQAEDAMLARTQKGKF